jgi:hypothetical protein
MSKTNVARKSIVARLRKSRKEWEEATYLDEYFATIWRD